MFRTVLSSAIKIPTVCRPVATRLQTVCISSATKNPTVCINSATKKPIVYTMPEMIKRAPPKVKETRWYKQLIKTEEPFKKIINKIINKNRFQGIFIGGILALIGTLIFTKDHNTEDGLTIWLLAIVVSFALFIFGW